MTIPLDLPVVQNKANFGGRPSPAACPSWFQGQSVPEKGNAVSGRHRGDPNRAKQSQFVDDGIHFNIFAAEELCEIALETGHEKQSQFRGLAQPGFPRAAGLAFGFHRFFIFCRKVVRGCTI